MKRLLLILVLALPVAWWFKDPANAKAKLDDLLHRLDTTSGGLVSRFMGKSENGPSYEKRTIERIEDSLPEGVYLLRENVIARFLPVPGTILKGSKVKVIGQAEGKNVVTDGTRQALVESQMLTRDADEIPGLLRAAQEGQQAARDKRKAELESNLQQIDSKIASVTRELAVVRRRDAVALQDGKKHAQYGTQEGFLVTEIRRQEGFRDAVMKEIETLSRQ